MTLRSDTRASVMAWSMVAVTVVLLLGSFWFGLLDADYGVFGDLPLVLAFALVGAIIATNQPRNVVGWMFCLEGFVVAWLLFFQGYATHALRTDPGSLPAGDWAAWLGIWPIDLTPGLIMVALLLFPYGMPLSWRWRWVARCIAAISIALSLVSFLWDVNVTRSYNFPEAHFPLSLPGTSAMRPVYSALQTILLPMFLVVLLSIVLRYRRGTGEERVQIRWLAYACVLLVIAMLAPFFMPDAVAVIPFTIMAPLIPIAAGIAITRYRLYEIDRIISRTLAYGAVTAVLAAAYFAFVLGVSVVSPLHTDSPIAVAISTLVVAACFRPLRARTQSLVDRRFSRAHYDAVHTLETFTGRLRDEVDLEALGAQLTSVVAETMQPATISLWLLPQRADDAPVTAR